MSDTLRDRIAAATAEAITTRPIPTGGYDQEDWLRLANAVIAELGLRIDRVGSVSRWVSEWVPDE